MPPLFRIIIHSISRDLETTRWLVVELIPMAMAFVDMSRIHITVITVTIYTAPWYQNLSRSHFLNRKKKKKKTIITQRHAMLRMENIRTFGREECRPR